MGRGDLGAVASRVLRVDDVIDTYRVSRSTAYRLLRLHGFRIGKSLRIREHIVRELLDEAPLDARRIEEPPVECGVYMLCRGGEVVYVGQSQDVHERVRVHRLSKTFDAAVFVPIPYKLLSAAEIVLVRMLRPQGNTNAPPATNLGSRDLLRACGILRANWAEATESLLRWLLA